ncbi:hypothetical protein Tsubulata_018028 [Turnera subulata]|uniref:DUF4283 domain-containing protein n=1 Tax=Turnera subulata TaxID=218843 RepID=A0A9Q0G0Y7_9ROSI|nr:hypothetical protein Tsubulata_018028 [Turnera subulata]
MGIPTSPMSPHLNRPTPPPPPPLPKNTEPHHTQSNNTYTQEPQQNITQSYFSKWSREQVQHAIENGQAVSIYVKNIQSNWNPVDIFKIMSKYGEVMDVYIPMKRTNKVGILKKPKHIESAHYVWALHGYGEVQVSDLGGDSILACFPTKSSMDQFFHKTPDWIRLWFTSFKPWEKGNRVENRWCWLTVRGVPLNAWCTEFFNLIASFFGQKVRIARDTDQRRYLDAASIEVLTTHRGVISRDLKLNIAEQIFTISVTETPSVVCNRCLGTAEEEFCSSDQEVPNESPVTGKSQGSSKCMVSPANGEDPFNLMSIIKGPNQGRLGSASPKPYSESSSTTQPLSSNDYYSSSSQYTQYLERRLARAILSGRVNRGKKFMRIRDTGSLVSIASSSNDDIRRVNVRLSQAEPHQEQSSSFTVQEAQETVALGNKLGWDVLGIQQQVTLMAKDLVEKEDSEWSHCQANV